MIQCGVYHELLTAFLPCTFVYLGLDFALGQLINNLLVHCGICSLQELIALFEKFTVTLCLIMAVTLSLYSSKAQLIRCSGLYLWGEAGSG
jgi:hypothetical protein